MSDEEFTWRGYNAFTMPYGKHKGKLLKNVPESYIEWLCSSGALDLPENRDLKKYITLAKRFYWGKGKKSNVFFIKQEVGRLLEEMDLPEEDVIKALSSMVGTRAYYQWMQDDNKCPEEEIFDRAVKYMKSEVELDKLPYSQRIIVNIINEEIHE